jgi:acetolactate synthase-1/2/3 large subunit
MSRLTGAHLIMRSLKLEGIRRIFTLVGDTILPICDAAVDEGIELVDTRHEGAAMSMADAWCRITGEPAVAIVTGGPGFANALSALPHIYSAESPVIFIAGSGPLPEMGMYSFQEVDQVAMAAPSTKGSWLVHEKRRIPSFMAAAFRTAMSGRPGPVHLTIPIDIQEQEVSAEDLLSYGPSEYRHHGNTQGDQALIKDAIDLLRNAQRPVVVTGNPARYSIAPRQLREFAETTGLPVFTVEQARGLLDDEHPLCFGYGDPGLNYAARHFREADAVLLLGKRLDHSYRYGRSPFFRADAKIIQVDPTEVEIGRNRAITLGIVGDLGRVVDQLTEEAATSTWNDISSWREQLHKTRQSWRETLEANATDDLPLHPMKVMKEMEQFIDDDAFIIIDGGDFVHWGRSYLKARRPGRWLRLASLGHLGCGLPFALSAKLADPTARVFLFIGDGSLGFYLMEFDTAIRHNLPFTTVLGNDSAWGIDKGFQLAYFGRSVGTDLRNVRYDQVVQALGGHGEYVEKGEDVAPAVQRAIDSQKPSLVNIVIKSIASPMAQAMIDNKTSK